MQVEVRRWEWDFVAHTSEQESSQSDDVRHGPKQANRRGCPVKGAHTGGLRLTRPD